MAHLLFKPKDCRDYRDKIEERHGTLWGVIKSVFGLLPLMSTYIYMTTPNHWLSCIS